MKTKHIIIPFVSTAVLAFAAPVFAEVEPASEKASAKEDAPYRYLQQKLNNIIIPKVDIKDLTVRECLDVLRLRAREHDPEPDENRKGVNIVIAGKAPDIAERKVDRLVLTNVPLGTILLYMCAQTGLRYSVGEHVVAISMAK